MATEQLVKLYYLGGLTPTGVSAPMTSYNRAYMLPKIGEYIEVPQRVAMDLNRKHKIITREGEAFPAFTEDKRLAERVKRGESPWGKPRTVLDAKALSDDALMAELERRRALQETSTPSQTAPVVEPDFDLVDLTPMAGSQKKGSK